MSGGPLVVLIDDDGTFRDRLSSEIRRRDAGTETAPAAAPTFPELPAEPIAEAAELRLGARRLLARAGDDLQVRLEAEKLLDAAHDVGGHVANASGRRGLPRSPLS